MAPGLGESYNYHYHYGGLATISWPAPFLPTRLRRGAPPPAVHQHPSRGQDSTRHATPYCSRWQAIAANTLLQALQPNPTRPVAPRSHVSTRTARHGHTKTPAAARRRSPKRRSRDATRLASNPLSPSLKREVATVAAIIFPSSAGSPPDHYPSPGSKLGTSPSPGQLRLC